MYGEGWERTVQAEQEGAQAAAQMATATCEKSPLYADIEGQEGIYRKKEA